LRAERVILNIVARLCGIATLTSRYVRALDGTNTRLLDTRKTQPGMRGLDKYAVAVGGGVNHRFSLADMLMLKDNHIDAAGSITGAVARLRAASAGLPLEVECRTPAEVAEAAACKADRIMLDNMDDALLAESLALIPPDIEAEISGNVTLETIRALALIGDRRPDFISVGRITHSAPIADLSMRLAPEVSPHGSVRF
jgi:nicotinate-nucleotide pyrophosphorylase (carboxylating)